uniref:MATH domain-containing protein n=1 Tax=Panagrolaimus sp. ES5 TaxID=591445 RepID=A0AC34FB18_9BILA
MESSFSTSKIACPFEIESKFKKSDLIALKDSENGFLKGKYFYAFNIPGLQYHVKIYPNGDEEDNRGETWIYLRVNGSKERKITTKFTIAIESANYSESFDEVYETFTGWGSTCCKSDEFFDSKNKYFVNEEVTIKIKGIFKTDKPLFQKTSTPISIQWKIKEDVLLAKKGLKNGRLISKRRNVPSFSEKPATWGYLNIEMENEKKKIEAVYDISVDSVNYSEVVQEIFDKSEGYGLNLCSTDDLFDPTNGYIADGFLTINFNGILLTETDEKTETIFKKKVKDFTIIIGDKEIKDLVENDLIKKVSPSNVVQIIHFTKTLTASKLHQSCIEFLLKCSKESTPVLGVESLGDRFLATCFLETFRPVDSDAESDNYEDSEVENSDDEE